ncbi:MAG: biotin carboxylase N-terminal domain-containing protein, partial [Myxococcota bacterium]|nr:biotin carboxylase N-terminal domain-containing protein [Myxococcota bacterium]
MRKLLIANRGEIAIRIGRAAAELGIETLAVAPADDESCLHVRRADGFERLEGRGAAAYLDAAQIVAVAEREGCQAIHPGYGFLSENAAFAEACENAGITFVGPTPAQLGLLGDKLAARGLATELGVPVLPGSKEPARPAAARSMLEEQGEGARLVVKAVGGGGGRGLRVVERASEVDAAFERCATEARAWFGSSDLYLELFVARARHLEVQIVGDGTGAVVDLGERECTLQRQNQKVVEQAPSSGLDPQLRASILDAARRMAASLDYRSLGTFEFLLDRDSGRVYFIEANPRLQVEHPVTEWVTGVDLVQTQLRLASGETLDSLGLADGRALEGSAIELRINTETMTREGGALPRGGTLTAFSGPGGPGVRVDTHAYAGYATSPEYDSLLAKVIVHSAGDHAAAAGKARRALDELRIEGVETNAAFLRELLGDDAVIANDVDTRYIARNAARLLDALGPPEAAGATELAGVRVDAGDPLAVLEHGTARPVEGVAPAPGEAATPGAVLAPIQGTIVSVEVAPGDPVAVGSPLLVMEAMKMEHVVA